MNIIPFVTIMLLVLSLISTQLLTRTRSTLFEQIADSGYHEALRNARSEIEVAAYESFIKKNRDKPVKKPKATTPKKEKKTEKNIYIHSRLKAPFSKQSKLNITPLFGKTEQKELKKIAKALFCELYSHVADQDTLNMLFNAILRKGQTLRKNEAALLAFTDLYPDDQSLLYYRLLRGTQTFDIEEQVGIPSIENFFTLSKEPPTEKFLSFSLASKPLLVAAFGKKFANAVLKKEDAIAVAEEKRRSLNQKEYDELLNQFPSISQKAQELRPHLAFNHSERVLSEVAIGESPITGIKTSVKL